MRRSDWLLLFISAGGGAAVDPVRIQKGLFLLAMSGLVPEGQRYEFEPYLYGPMSRELYRDVRDLLHRGLIESVADEQRGWRPVGPSPDGRRRAAQLLDAADHGWPEAAARVAAIRRDLDGMSFADLLDHVYARYPEYATRSVFRRP